MAVFRVHKSENYTVMSNHHLRNKDLSLSAKGLLSVILSLPPDWKYSIHGLASISKEGDKAIKSALDELKEHGYLTVTRINPERGHNRVQYEYDVYEEPLFLEETTKPQVAEPYPREGVQPEGVQPEGVPEGGQLSTYELSTDLSSTDLSNTDNLPSSPSKAETIRAIIDYFNQKVGTRYTYRNKKINGLVSARLGEGFTVEDFKTVIDNKVADWTGTEWEKYLKPTTLFAPSHFKDYLNERPKGGAAHVDYSEYDAAFYGG